MVGSARLRTTVTVLLAMGIAVLGWAARAHATAPTCDGSWTDDRGASPATITYPNYSPSEILITTGQTVNWTSNTSTFKSHPLVDASGKLWGTFSVDEAAWPFTYRQAGAWGYYDKNNTADQGIVCVEGPPTPAFTATPSHPTHPQSVTFDASKSHLAACCASSIAHYEWNFGSRFTDNGTNSTMPHVFSADGTYRVQLEVIDNLGGTQTKSALVSIGTITQAPKVVSTSVKETSHGKAPLGIKNPNAINAAGRVTLTQGGTQIGTARFAVPGYGTATVPVGLSSSARTYLTHHSSLTAKAMITLSGNGTSKSGTYTVTIHR